MKLGYIHNNREEQTRVLQILKMTSESVALDELGIGRIRDAFADRMFPGISTLQKHTKYFSLMPQLYHKAIEKRYNRLSEVKAEITRLERIMTAKLYETSGKRGGITGSDMISKNLANYVKYDPDYIYNSGLQTFEILRSSQLYELIYSTSKALHDAPKPKKSDNEDIADDSDDKCGIFQFCSFPLINYDFTKECSLDLTLEDRDFIVNHILHAQACRGTLLRYIVDNPSFELAEKFESIPSQSLPPELGELQDLARRFADFIYMIHLRYNYIYSKYEDNEMLHQFEEELGKYQNSGTDINKVLDAITIRENSGKLFCKKVAEQIAKKDIKENGELDQLIINRERIVKGSRRKIDNYIYDKKKRIHYYKLTYRWETVKLFAEELRKEVTNG